MNFYLALERSAGKEVSAATAMVQMSQNATAIYEADGDDGGKKGQSGTEKSKRAVFIGDKFETAMAQKDVARGALDANVLMDKWGPIAEASGEGLASMIPLERLLGLAVRYLGIGRLNASAASVYDKLARYLLNLEHAVSGSKAKWFQEALGFTSQNIDALASQIVFDAKTAVHTAVTEYGTKYNQVIKIVGANGKAIDVTFAWIKDIKDGKVKLVTAIPPKSF